MGPLDPLLRMACDGMVTNVLNGGKFSELWREKINAFEVSPNLLLLSKEQRRQNYYLFIATFFSVFNYLASIS